MDRASTRGAPGRARRISNTRHTLPITRPMRVAVPLPRPPILGTVVTLTVALGISAGDAADPRLLLPGQYHGDEVTAVSGETWMAMVRGDRGTDRLTTVTVAVDIVRDDLLDHDGPPTGKRVTAAPGGDAILFLMRNVSGVRNGPVTTVAADVPLSTGEPLECRLGGVAYQVALSCDGRGRSAGSEPACSLLVRRGREAQVLRTYHALVDGNAIVGVGDDATPRVVWAGDLNRDGALDLLIDLTDHYNVSQPTLFLSPGRREGPWLERVAEHRSVGC